MSRRCMRTAKWSGCWRPSFRLICRDSVPLMRKRGGGNIINVTSIAARHGGGPGAYLYAGAKGLVSTATRGLAKELVPDRIRVNAVAPGVITTPFHDRFSTPQMLESFKATIPMGRLGTPEECVGAFGADVRSGPLSEGQAPDRPRVGA